MKKIWFILIIAISVFGFACGRDSDVPRRPFETPTPQATPTPSPRPTIDPAQLRRERIEDLNRKWEELLADDQDWQVEFRGQICDLETKVFKYMDIANDIHAGEFTSKDTDLRVPLDKLASQTKKRRIQLLKMLYEASTYAPHTPNCDAGEGDENYASHIEVFERLYDYLSEWDMSPQDIGVTVKDLRRSLITAINLTLAKTKPENRRARDYVREAIKEHLVTSAELGVEPQKFSEIIKED